jgi:hypothetical protein
MLTTLLRVAVGTSQQSGVVAGAADVWAAEELRRAGFHEDDVWPRRTAPRVMPRDVRNLVQGGLTQQLRKNVEARYGSPGARKALPAEAQVMGRAYTKQSDVLIASWPAGVEVLISSKTMLSSYQKNLRNRFEEAYGDAKNIRGRHPLAALGFLFIAGSDIPETAGGLTFAIDMLMKLTMESDVYDCACLLVVDGAQGVEEEEEEPRPADEELPSLDVGPAAEPGDATENALEPGAIEAPQAVAEAVQVTLRPDLVPESLGANKFFERLISAALTRMPVSVYPEVRRRRAAAQAAGADQGADE